MSSNCSIGYSFAQFQLKLKRAWCKMCLHEMKLAEITKSFEVIKTTLSSKISRRVASGIADEAVIFEHAQCIITTSCIEANQEKII
jgi:hypothetical protein